MSTNEILLVIGLIFLLLLEIVIVADGVMHYHEWNVERLDRWAVSVLGIGLLLAAVLYKLLFGM